MNHVTLAASENAFVELFNALRENFVFDKSGPMINYGPFSASYDVHAHLEGGSMQLKSDGTVEVKTVDIVWDTLEVELCLTLPEWCVGGWCIIPDPWNGCLVYFPEFCIGGNTVCLPINLSGLVSEVNTIRAHLDPSYFVDPGRLAGWSDLDAEFNGTPNKWRVFLDPDFVSVDPIDIPATLGNVVEDLVHDAINDLLWFLPDDVQDLLWGIIAPMIDILKEVLGFVDTFEDWFQDLLGETFDFVGQLETLVADYFASQYPIFEFEDPYPVLPQSGALIPVKIPLRDLAATVNTDEMIVTANVGAA